VDVMNRMEGEDDSRNKVVFIDEANFYHGGTANNHNVTIWTHGNRRTAWNIHETHQH
jgi:hypothetical protein